MFSHTYAITLVYISLHSFDKVDRKVYFAKHAQYGTVQIDRNVRRDIYLNVFYSNKGLYKIFNRQKISIICSQDTYKHMCIRIFLLFLNIICTYVRIVFQMPNIELYKKEYEIMAKGLCTPTSQKIFLNKFFIFKFFCTINVTFHFLSVFFFI